MRGVRPIGLWSMSITLSISASPSIFSCAPTARSLPWSARASAGYRISLTSVLLPAPDTPVTRDQPEREVDVTVLQVVLPRALDAEAAPLPLRRSAGTSIARSPREIAAGELAFDFMTCAGVPGGHHLAAVPPGARAEVDHPVGGLDRLLVVLDDDHGVADVAQVLERCEQPRLSRWCRPIEGSSST